MLYKIIWNCTWTATPYLILCLFMASTNCSVSMMGTATLQNAMICSNALPMQYAHTNTHNTHTRSHHSKSTQTLYVHCIHICIYLHTNALFVLCDFIETATVAPLYIPSAISEILHWTTAHHLSHPLLCVPACLKHNYCAYHMHESDGHVSNYYQDCTLCITLE